MTVCVLLMDEDKGRIGDPAPLAGLAKPSYDLINIREVGIEGDVVLIRREDAVISPAQQDLACSRSRRIEMP